MRRRLWCALLVGALFGPGAAIAEPGATGEVLVWEVHYLGLHVGDATAEVLDDAEGHRILCTASSSTWAGRIYAIDDRVESWWTPGEGSSRYKTIFREGRFHQDQDMLLGAESIVVERRQRFDEGWREWSDTYPGQPGPLEDPVSAFYRLRALPLELGGAYTFPVFTGKKIIEITATVEAEEAIDGAGSALRTRLTSPDYGRGEILVWLTSDAERLPVRVIWKSGSFGSVRAELIQEARDGGS